MDSTPQMPGARANRAGNPGSGAGNVPFAGGVMSGKLGQQTNPSMGRMNGPSGGLNINIQSGPPPEKPPGAVPEPGGGGPMSGGPPAPVINPQAMMDVYNAYFQSLMDAVSKGKTVIGGIY